MIIDVAYDGALHQTSLRRNVFATQYAAERDAALLDLRYRFRNLRCALVTFASGQRYVQHQRVLTASAAATGEFQVIESWSFDRLSATPFFEENRDILLRTRGQGYWLWKPYLIWHALEASADGDVIVYNDCLPEDGNVFDRSILPMVAWLEGHERRLAIARKPALNQSWTKRDCFHYMGCDAPTYWGREQVIATYLAFIAGPATRKMAADWLHFCRDARILTDDPNTCGLDNLPGFQDHRHDQSVLSNLLVRDDFDIPDIRFGDAVSTKHLRDMLGIFEDRLISQRLQSNCISLGKPWTQSSASVWSPTQGTMEEDDGARDFFFHTEQELAPWWSLDLEGVYRVDRIEILNRPAPLYAWRANRLKICIGMSADDLHLVFDAVADGWNALSPIVIELENEPIRFIKISLENNGTLHLKDVKVFGKSM